MRYIDKDAIVAEIERRKHKLLDHVIFESDKEWVVRTAHQFNRIIMFIDTLEVKEVEEPNASDRGMAEEIIINLKRVEQDYRIDLAKEIEWLRNKVKKGE